MAAGDPIETREFGEVTREYCGPPITDEEAKANREFVVRDFNEKNRLGVRVRVPGEEVDRYTSTQAYLKDGAPVVGVTSTPGGRTEETVAVAALKVKG